MNRFRYLVLIMAMAAGACSSGDENLATPIAPTTPTLSQEFAGTLTQNGATSYPFAVVVSGTVTAVITALSPDSATVVGLGIGLWDGVGCQSTPGIWNDRATTGTRVVGQVTGSANLCVRIYDSKGDLPQPTDYTILVEHP